MVRRTREAMQETRATLLATARTVFSTHGYAQASMDDLTAQAGLTRGALYHHFGDKEGLLRAVVDQMDAEMDARLQAISTGNTDLWQGFCQRCRAYLEMAVEPEIQRIVLRDARAVLGPASAQSQRHCLDSMQALIAALIEHHIIQPLAPEALAALLYGCLAESALWIAQGDDAQARLAQSMAALNVMLDGLRLSP